MRNRAIIALLLGAVIGTDPAPQTLDNCDTDTSCYEAGMRHCANGESEWCEEIDRTDWTEFEELSK